MKIPKYVRTGDGYIGVLVKIDDIGPLYRFPGGVRYSDQWEIANGSDNREDLEGKE